MACGTQWRKGSVEVERRNLTIAVFPVGVVLERVNGVGSTVGCVLWWRKSRGWWCCPTGVSEVDRGVLGQATEGICLVGVWNC